MVIEHTNILRHGTKGGFVRILTDNQYSHNTSSIERKCPICGKVFILNYLNKGKKRDYCYDCLPKDEDRQYSKAECLRKALKKILVDYKGGKCEKCGYDKRWEVLEFHHINKDEKIFTLSQIRITKNIDMDTIYKEVDKCKLLCANCHREVHLK